MCVEPKYLLPAVEFWRLALGLECRCGFGFGILFEIGIGMGIGIGQPNAKEGQKLREGRKRTSGFLVF
jgi:hypothetical protein